MKSIMALAVTFFVLAIMAWTVSITVPSVQQSMNVGKFFLTCFLVVSLIIFFVDYFISKE